MTVFGEVASEYDDVRPGYPPVLTDLVDGYHGRAAGTVVDVGAGTGKATQVLAGLVAAGGRLVCVEPDAKMASVLRQRFPRTEVEVTTFEGWTPPPGGVDVLGCGLAWHWLDPLRRNDLAAAALADGGTLAVLAHRYGFADAEQGRRVSEMLDTVEPGAGQDRPEHWLLDDVTAAGVFTDVEEHVVRTEVDLSLSRYLALFRTFSPFLRRSPEQRAAVVEGLTRVVAGTGGHVVVALRTTLVLGRRPPS